jgi:DNA-nicking Smr family endonuclease
MHRPFLILGDLVKRGDLRLVRGAKNKHELEKSDKSFTLSGNSSEGGLFEKAMENVRPLSKKHMYSSVRKAIEIRANGDEEEVLKALTEFCRDGRVDVKYSREYVEHWSNPLGRLYIEQLSKGAFAVQAHLDLHGHKIDRARDAINKFIETSIREGYSCVRIVHGRGLHSPEGHSILKEKVHRWLRTRRLARFIAAYTSARNVDGGGGAVYVLLRSPH